MFCDRNSPESFMPVSRTRLLSGAPVPYGLAAARLVLTWHANSHMTRQGSLRRDRDCRQRRSEPVNVIQVDRVARPGRRIPLAIRLHSPSPLLTNEIDCESRSTNVASSTHKVLSKFLVRRAHTSPFLTSCTEYAVGIQSIRTTAGQM